MPARCDVAVVGGGAAGLAACVAAAEAGASVVVLERDVACGRTVLATGNGRCNFSNAELSWERYNDPAFVSAVCGPSFGADVLALFEGCGLAWAEEAEGRLYPLSRQAASVREALLARARRAGAVLAAARAVGRVARGGRGGWRVRWREGFGDGREGELAARAVVVAVGGGAHVVGDLARLGLASAPWRPVLCPLACEPVDSGLSLDALDGRRAHVVARLLRDGFEVGRASGEALLRAYGLSGIVTFDLSRVALPGDVVSLDLTDGLDPERARELARRAGGAGGVVDPRIAEALGADLTPEEAVERLRDLRLVVTGPAEPERAQVARGGLVASQFEPSTLEAHEVAGLFACGEALDVDGACGGFNLAWAWKSGLVAGAGAAAYGKEGDSPC